MRKIHILKAIVDFIWIMTIVLIPVIIIFIPLLFIYDVKSLDFTISNVDLSTITIFGKILISMTLISYLMIIYSLYLFRKILDSFIRLKIFNFYVIKTFQKIGVLLVLSGVTTFIISFTSDFYFQQKLKLEIGINEHIVILCLGLFFMILSEIFKIAKSAKEENELTI
ncbi:MAG: DUF2975 domain-containing protein [Flavobacteriaceae bacterium]